MQNRWSSVLVTLLTGICLLAGTARGADTRKITKMVNVAYPALALQARLEGTVKLEAVVGSNGNVNNVIVVSGPVLLRSAAIECVKQWQYEPAKDTTLMPISIDFKLNR